MWRSRQGSRRSHRRLRSPRALPRPRSPQHLLPRLRNPPLRLRRRPMRLPPPILQTTCPSNNWRVIKALTRKEKEAKSPNRFLLLFLFVYVVIPSFRHFVISSFRHFVISSFRHIFVSSSRRLVVSSCRRVVMSSCRHFVISSSRSLLFYFFTFHCSLLMINSPSRCVIFLRVWARTTYIPSGRRLIST